MRLLLMNIGRYFIRAFGLYPATNLKSRPQRWIELQGVQSKRELEQRWFVGAHANIGGGYPNDDLHRIPLLGCATRRLTRPRPILRRWYRVARRVRILIPTREACPGIRMVKMAVARFH